jgi:cytochrome c oxidase cbb3-type subunit III
MSDRKREIDSVSGVETTGHEWDGLKELNNPAPRWWVMVWIITIIWSIGYWVVYPSWPTLSGHTVGKKGWSEYSKLKEDQAEILARRAKYQDKFAAASLEDITKNQELYAYAQAGGAAAFKDNCATCHGTGGAGGPGYPNLNDDDWLWGGKLDEIYTTIQYGIRSGHENARDSMMPSFGKDGTLKADQISQVADYVLTLNKGGDAALAGAAIYAENCASCHGDKGQGGREFGAPKLNDAIWLYGSSKADIVRQINVARSGIMPTWSARLNDNTIKQLTVYIHSLGGGE